MRKLVLMVQLSVDGYMADENGSTDWMVFSWNKEWTWDAGLRKYFTDLTASVDTILLGRNMAVDGYNEHWEHVANDTDNPQSEFAKNVVESQKVVFSNTLNKSVWNNTIIASGDLAEQVNKLKDQAGKNMIVYGGATFVRSLINAGLIDEFQLFINPATVGKGTSVFCCRTDLVLVNAKSYDCGVAVLTYESKK
jgi:dihydrofolate reductase